MLLKRILLTLILSAGYGVSAGTITWDFTSGKTVDAGGKFKLTENGTTSFADGGRKTSSGSSLTGSSKTFSLEQGTFIVDLKISEAKDWDGILQTHIGHKNKEQIQYMGIGLKLLSNGVIQVHSIPGGQAILSPAGTRLSDGKFHQLALTYCNGKAADGKGTAFYLDGRLIGRTDYNGKDCWDKGVFYLGMNHNESHSPGMVLRRAVYCDRALTTAEIAGEYETCKPGKSAVAEELKNEILPDGGFEVTGSDNRLKYWAQVPLFSVDTAEPWNGKVCLKYENNDPKKYFFPSCMVNLQPGKRYRLSGMIRVKDITGPGVGACIGIEYFNREQKYLGGTYSKGMKGTDSRWTLFEEVTNTIPAGTASCRVICFVRQGMTGIAWWDDLTITPYYGDVLSGIGVDAYRNESAGGMVKVSTGINRFSEKGRLADRQLDLRLEVIDAANKTVLVTKPRTLKEDTAEFQFDSGTLAAGKYTLKIKAEIQSTGKTETMTGCFEKLRREPERKVYIDKYKRMIVDGKPFFPLGTYWSKVDEAQLREYRDSPFNCLMPYERLCTQQLDLIHKYGMKTFYSLKDCYFGTRWCPKEITSLAEESAYVEKLVREFRTHPALLAWYVNDERPVSMLPRLLQRQELMKNSDPDHPTWTVLCRLDEIRPLSSTADVIGSDPYPIPDMPASAALEYTRATEKGSFGDKAVWMVPQIFNWAAYSNNVDEKKRFRAPTLLEMRSMAWQCIAGGANGLIFYSWFDLQKMDGVDPVARRWPEVKVMAEEIKKFSPILLSVEPIPGCEVKCPAEVAWRLYQMDGRTYAVVVNSSNQPLSGTLQLSRKISTVETVMGKIETSVKDNKVSFRLGALEPAILSLQ